MFDDRDFRVPSHCPTEAELEDLARAEKRYMDSFEKAARGIHIANGISRQEREIRKLRAEANKAGKGEAAACLATACAALQDAREELKK